MSVRELGPTSFVLVDGTHVWAADFRDRAIVLTSAAVPRRGGPGIEHRASLRDLDARLFDANRPDCLRAPTELIITGADCTTAGVILTIAVDQRSTVLAGARLAGGWLLTVPIHVPHGRPFRLEAAGPKPFMLCLHTLIKVAADTEALLDGREA
ncbi:MAG: hypothetical protein IPJ61_19805 [Tessaracoccus sp.]|jgi:hypothetical protein|uniref:hypothetical protein n=1 Tax=Tessaracoccus sp. TaxID=1971211 RepID=UPI001EB366C1|nr:hypothetical protein [Tessaracoccus sp.]MBK7823232.1 hypothetical protein [Tessaracoccus sp.]